MSLIRGTGIMRGSPKAKLILRNLEDFPELPIDAHMREADRLLDEAAGRKRYKVFTLKQDHARREKLKEWRESHSRRDRG